MKRNISIAVIILIVLQLLLCRQFWLTQLGSLLIYEDKIEPADAILVLGGGAKERVLEGIELVKQKYADRILFTGENAVPLLGKPTNWAIEAQELAVSLGLRQDQTITILDSQSTRDDALLSREICIKDHFRSLIVVSEPYHTRRAHFVFNKVYRGSGIKITIYPVQNSWYKRDTWWKYKKGFWNTNVEYQKMLYYLFKGYLV